MRPPGNDAMDEINQRLEGTYEGEGPPAPQPHEPVAPPPAPPAPPQAGFDTVRPAFVVATL